MEFNIFTFLGQLLNLLPNMVIIGFLIYFLNKTKSIEGFLLLIGIGIGFLINVFYSFFFGKLIANNIINVEIIQTIIKFIGLIGSAFFTIGLILLLTKIIKLEQNKETI